jgi:hypothetical protein
VVNVVQVDRALRRDAGLRPCARPILRITRSRIRTRSSISIAPALVAWHRRRRSHGRWSPCHRAATPFGGRRAARRGACGINMKRWLAFMSWRRATTATGPAESGATFTIASICSLVQSRTDVADVADGCEDRAPVRATDGQARPSQPIATIVNSVVPIVHLNRSSRYRCSASAVRQLLEHHAINATHTLRGRRRSGPRPSFGVEASSRPSGVFLPRGLGFQLQPSKTHPTSVGSLNPAIGSRRESLRTL